MSKRTTVKTLVGPTPVTGSSGTSANTPSTGMARDGNSNTFINRAIPASQSRTTGTALTVASAPFQFFTGSTANQTYFMPDCTTLTTTTFYTFFNTSSTTIAIVDAGGNSLAQIPINNPPVTLYCTSTGSANGTWRVDFGLPPQTTSTTVGMKLKSNGITYSQGVWSPGDNLDLANNTTTYTVANSDAKYDIFTSLYSGGSSKTISLLAGNNVNFANKLIWFYNQGGGNFIISNSGGSIVGPSGSTSLSLNTSGQCALLYARGSDYYVLYVGGTHRVAYGTAPTIAAGVGAGTSPTISIAGADEASEISITAGTTPTAAALLATVTFNKPYGTAPIIALTSSNVNAASQLVFVNSTTTGYTLTLATGTLVSTTQYKWMVHVKGY